VIPAVAIQKASSLDQASHPQVNLVHPFQLYQNSLV